MNSKVTSAPRALDASGAWRLSSTSASGMKSTHLTMWSLLPWAKAGARRTARMPSIPVAAITAPALERLMKLRRSIRCSLMRMLLRSPSAGPGRVGLVRLAMRSSSLTSAGLRPHDFPARTAVDWPNGEARSPRQVRAKLLEKWGIHTIVGSEVSTPWRRRSARGRRDGDGNGDRARSAEGQSQRDGSRADGGRAQVQPAVTAEVIVDIPARVRPEPHPRGGDEEHGAVRRPHDPVAEVLAGYESVERHDTPV